MKDLLKKAKRNFIKEPSANNLRIVNMIKSIINRIKKQGGKHE